MPSDQIKSIAASDKARAACYEEVARDAVRSRRTRAGSQLPIHQPGAAASRSDSQLERERSALWRESDNERLEFLGDSVLGWIVSEWLFHHYPDFTEGQLSSLKNHLVSAKHLLAAAQKLDLGSVLRLGKGEESAGGRAKQRLLVNAFEAVLAAVYLDGGPDAARALRAAQRHSG